MQKHNCTFTLALITTCSLFGAAEESTSKTHAMRIGTPPSLQLLAVEHYAEQILQRGSLIESPSDLQAGVDRLSLPDIMVPATNGEYISLQKAVFNLVAEIMAKDACMHITDPNDSVCSAWRIPIWLLPYFNGLSMQDFINRNVTLPIRHFTLKLGKNVQLFGLAGLSQLPNIEGVFFLCLDGNTLTSITPGAFSGLKHMTDLRIQNNIITELLPRTFEGLTGLQILEFNANQLATIASESFVGLSELYQLNLVRNNLTHIDRDTFKGLDKLEQLYLTNNSITSIAPGSFAHLTQLKNLRLEDNPIAENQEERARIAEEVSIATNGQAEILWDF